MPRFEIEEEADFYVGVKPTDAPSGSRDILVDGVITPQWVIELTEVEFHDWSHTRDKYDAWRRKIMDLRGELGKARKPRWRSWNRGVSVATR